MVSSDEKGNGEPVHIEASPTVGVFLEVPTDRATVADPPTHSANVGKQNVAASAAPPRPSVAPTGPSTPKTDPRGAREEPQSLFSLGLARHLVLALFLIFLLPKF